jgi:hypothetical protein
MERGPVREPIVGAGVGDFQERTLCIAPLRVNFEMSKIKQLRPLPFRPGVTTARLNEQVKRNREPFPADFMFSLSQQELTTLISQIKTVRRDVGNLCDLRGPAQTPPPLPPSMHRSP